MSVQPAGAQSAPRLETRLQRQTRMLQEASARQRARHAAADGQSTGSGQPAGARRLVPWLRGGRS